MKLVTRKKRLTCFVAHAPHLECCLPILERIAERQVVEVDLALNRRMLKTENQLLPAISKTLINIRIQSRVRLELFSFWDMRRADAILSYGEPVALRKKIRLRDHFLPASGTPSIFIQHGLIQEGVNLDCESLGRDWYSSLILWWTDVEPDRSPFLSDEVRQRVEVVGFIKKNMMPPREYPSDLMAFLNKFQKRILVCTNIPKKNYRFPEDTLSSLHQLLDEYCRRNPEHLVILRPHRAKKDTFGDGSAEALLADHENFIVMDRYSGPFAYSTIHDSLQLCDMVVGHASSAILDSIYAGKPTAVLQNDWYQFEPLDDVTDLQSFERFTTTATSDDPKHNAIRKRFGEMESNLDKAAELIEGLMIGSDQSK